jgi:hypothetical protein
MRRSVVESKIVVAYSRAIRPSESNVQIIAEKMENLLNPEDALTKLFARVLGRSLASVFQGNETMPDAFASIAMSIQEKGVTIVAPVGPTTTVMNASSPHVQGFAFGGSAA